MTNILVSGLINMEVTLRIEQFPVAYAPVRYSFFGVNSSVSGVGYNIAKALTTLGNSVRFLSLVGADAVERLVRAELAALKIADDAILTILQATPQSVILYDGSGRRAINVDLKDIQEAAYPPEQFEAALRGCDLAVLCNINYNRALLARAKRAGVPVATDVHTISDLDDDYNRDYMAAADILFMSDEYLPCSPEDWSRRVQERFGAAIVVIGLGAQGALLAVRDDNFMERIPAVQTRAVVNTIGAGDALFSAFNHAYAASHDPYSAIKQAVVFASYKIGTTGAADGFLTVDGLRDWCVRIYG